MSGFRRPVFKNCVCGEPGNGGLGKEWIVGLGKRDGAADRGYVHSGPIRLQHRARGGGGRCRAVALGSGIIGGRGGGRVCRGIVGRVGSLRGRAGECVIRRHCRAYCLRLNRPNLRSRTRAVRKVKARRQRGRRALVDRDGHEQLEIRGKRGCRQHVVRALECE